MKKYLLLASVVLTWISCKKGGDDGPVNPQPSNFSVSTITVDQVLAGAVIYNVNFTPAIKFIFPTKINGTTVTPALSFKNSSGADIPFSSSLQNGDSSVLVTPAAPLTDISKYSVSLAGGTLKSQAGGSLSVAAAISFVTKIDSTDKFPLISDNALLDLVQQQTFKYFWDFGHPTSGLARERNTSGDICTSGGSGFGVMAIIAAVNRGFITRAQALARLQTMVGFLKNTAQTFHGAYPHWLNGNSGVVVPFSTNDNGADLVETSYLIQGLLCARQYFNDAGAAETNLRTDINFICNRVEWDWFRQGTQNVLYWHWSPSVGWAMNMKIEGWNECLITYVLAASSTTHAIPAIVYTNGYARNGGIRNNNVYYNFTLPLGTAYGGPLFFSHYSFLGINPNGLTDQYANYLTQVVNHSKINYAYCVNNPQGNYGYSNLCWGLTASDIKNGYTASSPTNDVGVIAPTAALSSFAYTPTESMQALKFFYYKMGNRLWKEYGFVDAFSLKDQWFANSFLAIDQAPIIVMIENYRSGLLWNLFTSCPEVKNGMRGLGFTAPYL
ncbi:MAG: glucoamylase family protein [Ferruginibacter sp.]